MKFIEGILKTKATQTVVVESTNNASAATAAQINVVRLVATAACHVSFDGTAATTSDMLLPANQPELFRVEKGGTINVLHVSVDGVLYITEMTV